MKTISTCLQIKEWTRNRSDDETNVSELVQPIKHGSRMTKFKLQIAVAEDCCKLKENAVYCIHCDKTAKDSERLRRTASECKMTAIRIQWLQATATWLRAICTCNARSERPLECIIFTPWCVSHLPKQASQNDPITLRRVTSTTVGIKLSRPFLEGRCIWVFEARSLQNGADAVSSDCVSLETAWKFLQRF